MFRIAQVPCVCVRTHGRVLRRGSQQLVVKRCAINLYQQPLFQSGGPNRANGGSAYSPTHAAQLALRVSLFCHDVLIHFVMTTRLHRGDKANKHCSGAGGANALRRSGPRLVLLVEKWLLSHA